MEETPSGSQKLNKKREAIKRNPAKGKDVPIFTIPMLVVLRIMGSCEGLTCSSAQGIDLLVLNLRTRWTWAVNFTPWSLYFWGKRS